MNTPEDSALDSPPLINPATSVESSSPEVIGLDPDNPPWGLPAAGLTWLTSVFLIILIPGVAGLIYVATTYRGVPLSQEILFKDKNYILIVILGILPAHVLILLMSWAVASRLGKLSPFRTLGLSWPRNFGLWKSVGLAIVLFIVAMGLIYFFGGPDTDLERILRSSRAAALTMAFLATVTAPAMEEVVYRGLLYPAVKRWTGAVIAVILVTVIFAGLHVWQYWPNVGAISAICLLSLVLTAVRARTGKLLPCYVLHLVFNGIQSVIIVADPYIRSLVERPQPEAVPAILHLLLKTL